MARLHTLRRRLALALCPELGRELSAAASELDDAKRDLFWSRHIAAQLPRWRTRPGAAWRGLWEANTRARERIDEFIRSTSPEFQRELMAVIRRAIDEGWSLQALREAEEEVFARERQRATRAAGAT